MRPVSPAEAGRLMTAETKKRLKVAASPESSRDDLTSIAPVLLA
jgi:hypothetical protein